MKKILMLGFALCVFSPAAFANTDAVDAQKLPPVGAPAAAGAIGNAVTDAQDMPDPEDAVTPEQQAALICQSAEIMGQKLQGAEYVPGVDAYGRPVAPADVYNSMPFEVPEQIEVPIHADVMAALGVGTPPVEGMGEIGKLVINKGGTLLYNGADITNTIEGYCREHLKTMKMEEKKK